MTRIYYLREKADFPRGSKYKFPEMMSRVSQFEHINYNGNNGYMHKRLNGTSAACFVNGDKSTLFQYPIDYGLRYILNENDVASLRLGTEPTQQEIRALENASAVLFTSKAVEDYCHGIANIRHSEVVHLRPLKRDIGFEPLEKTRNNTVVYAGGLVTDSSEYEQYDYRKLDNLLSKIMDTGWEVHLYSSSFKREDIAEYYESIGCVVHGFVEEKDLYMELSQYTIGLQALSPESSIEYPKYCRPNKIWTYLGAGIPTVGINSNGAADIYRGKWGIDIEDRNPSSRKIRSVFEEAASMTISDEMRFSEVMDSDIGKFENLVKSLERN